MPRLVLVSNENSKLRELYDQAMADYRLRCFWNCAPSCTDSGLDVVVDNLRKYGNLKAWRLADAIEEERSDFLSDLKDRASLAHTSSLSAADRLRGSHIADQPRQPGGSLKLSQALSLNILRSIDVGIF